MECYCCRRHVRLVATVVIAVCIFISSSRAQNSVDVVEGKSALLECHFDPSLASRNPAYYWIRSNKNDKDNVAIEGRSFDNSYQLEFHPKEGKYDLRINSATYDRDNGKFECKLKESGSGNDLYVRTVQLTVLMAPKPPVISPDIPTATEGQKIDLVCSSVGGSPPPEIVWLRKGDSRPTIGVYKAGSTRDEPSTNTLSLVPKKEDDGSEWICEVWNRALPEGKKLHTSIQLNVNYYPRFKLSPYNPILMEKGSTASVSCEVDSKPPPSSVHWTRHGRVLSNDRTLTLQANGLEDAGAYLCEANNGLGEPKSAELTVDVLYPPIVTVESQREAEQGQSVTIQCNVTANPPATTIEWLKEGEPYFKQPGTLLRFDSIKAEDTGKYTCRAVNEVKQSGVDRPVEMIGNATTAILIKHKPGKAFIDPSKPIASEGEPFTMACQADPKGWPEPTYKWWRDGSNVTLSLGQKFTLTTARMSNEGTYYCKASNDLGDSTITSVVLQVFEPPRLIVQLPPQATRRAGDADYSINCSARGNPSPQVHWLKDGQPLETDANYEILTQDNFDKGYLVVEAILRFNGKEREPYNLLTSDDRGHYTCRFENEVKQVETTMLLRIEYPPIVIHPNDKVASDLFETAVLECRVLAYPTPQFEWSFNDGPSIAVSDKYDTNVTVLTDDVSVAILRVLDVQQSDFGDYTCKATNTIDETQTVIRMQPKSRPERPTNVEVLDTGYDYATVRWKEGFNGGFFNTTFSVHGTKSGDFEERAWDCQQLNPCNLTALEQQTKYVIHVQAHNFKGKSDFSDVINFTTKVNVEDIPEVFRVDYNKDTGLVEVRVRSTNIDLLGHVEFKANNIWVPYEETFPVTAGKGSLQLSAAYNQISTVRVSLCLPDSPLKCGPPQEANVVVLAALSEPEIIGIAAGCTIFAVVVILIGVVLCYCYRRGDKDKKIKKDYEMEAANARPKVVTPPAYRDGIVNKGADTTMEMDEATKNGIYSTGGHMMNGHMQNGGGYGYLDRDNGHSNNRGSIDSQDSLWIKTNSNLSSDRPYPYDPPPPMANSYMYPDDYHHMHEDMMNQRNRELLVNGDPYAAVNKPKKRTMDHTESPYRDVSGLPDPYMDDEESKPPHISLSFDDSLESGYSTPNSRSRRVIREIIV